VTLTAATLPTLGLVNLKTPGFPAHGSAPSGATVKLQFGALSVKAGENFQLELRKGGVDLTKRKGEIAANKVNQLQKYIVESPDSILYESQVMGLEYHVLSNVKVGSKTYSCEDAKGPLYTQRDAETMLKACQSLAD